MSDEECKCPPPGLPAWMGTFADLMSLLMCFFVLLLAFSEMDVLKFKQIAGSMKFAFGVQNKIEVKDIPKGTSVIAMEFTPGKPEPTPIETIQQQTVEMTQQMLEFQAGDESSAGGRQEQRGEKRGGESSSTSEEVASAPAVSAADQEQINDLVKKIAQQLEKQIIDGAIELESLGQQIIIRIRENGSFPSGSAFLQPQFKPIIQDIGRLLKDVPGEITVSGHTDDFQVSNELYINNWDLSSKRAVAVASELQKVAGFDKTRMMVVGRAETRPLVPNDSREDRRRNRRVEISILQGKAKESDPIDIR
ncbi:Flagellar motor protein MotB [Pseudoalteromonas sp. 3J6]|jgi:chemotaxis protein MotB|uniref:flagellar motor protein MotB n=2 Tax=Pseudoalteromonas TaxID=53246 RepID=UPI000948F22D|nr:MULTISPECIES: flagellar motor protein MotB [unclassified Pseudoalteromonas]MBL0688012.1 flagellar motor protein MotB [Pseudoalteromonas sp.]OLF73498.1 flagellar motor protein MotB [Pseudoalteromonas haloplanktis]MDN3485274.1 flagellar motor protein MotB [Pseudoalteromonas sp. APC 3224]QBJ62181.1 flagellar motor protein MotB [Pseudoalteromonas sp. DL-6]TMP60915.1 flagellar motor protein MotB [Pseudoalteromonas sp. S1610]|tara:strand:+ start:866 stop:1786 length:921 start_codon:yes stop_codon:yes gene_type:complete